MRKHFDLKIGFGTLPVIVEKSTIPPLSFRYGYNNQPVRQVYVTSNAEKIQTKDDIQQVVPFNQLQNLASDDSKFFEVDKNEAKGLFTQTGTIHLTGVFPMSEMPFYYFDGSHYFVNLNQNTCSTFDQVRYATYLECMGKKKEVFRVTYISGNREKFAILYPSIDGLRMSNLLYLDNQTIRKGGLSSTRPDPSLYEHIIRPYRNGTFVPGEDRYQKALQRIINRKRRRESDEETTEDEDYVHVSSKDA